jgi:hypothetical protein
MIERTTTFVPVVHLTEKEVQDLRVEEEEGLVPSGTVQNHFDAEARNVFGHDAKRDRNGNYIEQGIGSPGNLSVNHFAALLKAETDGIEVKGSYAKAVADLWKRDPARAEKLRLPKATAT